MVHTLGINLSLRGAVHPFKGSRHSEIKEVAGHWLPPWVSQGMSSVPLRDLKKQMMGRGMYHT